MVRVRVVLAFPAAILRGLSRDPTSLFFIVVLPVAIITIVGVAFGGQDRIEVGYVARSDGPISNGIVARLERDEDFRVTRYDDADALRQGVKRKDVAAGLVLPEGTDAAVATGETIALPVIAQTADSQGLAAFVALRAVVAPINAQVIAADVLSGHRDLSWAATFDEARAAPEGASADLDVRSVGNGDQATTNAFSLTAPQNLVLFVFTNAMTSAVFLVTARRDGVLHRALATRATPAGVMAGMGVAIFVVTIVQSTLIVVVGATAFRVRWGDPLSAIVLVVSLALAAAAVGVLVGSLGGNADRTAALAPIVGIVTAVIGGCIVPLEIFPEGMLVLARAMPQYWAVTAWQQLIFDGADLSDIGANVGILLSLALVAGWASVQMLRSELSQGSKGSSSSPKSVTESDYRGPVGP